MRRRVQANMPVTSWLFMLSIDNNSVNFPYRTDTLAVKGPFPLYLIQFSCQRKDLECTVVLTLNDVNRFCHNLLVICLHSQWLQKIIHTLPCLPFVLLYPLCFQYLLVSVTHGSHLLRLCVRGLWSSSED